MRLFKYVLLSLSATFYMDIRAEAKRRNVSVSTLIRTALKLYPSDPRLDPNTCCINQW
jgi:DNA-binding MurR/RpiR family transcriptional regulator